MQYQMALVSLFYFPSNIMPSKNVFFFLLWLALVVLSCTPVVNRNLKKR